MNRVVASLFLFCAFSCCVTPTAASIMFSDGDFNDADWEILAITSGNGGTWDSTQEIPGGNPNFYRRTTITTNPAPGPLETSKVTIFHLFDGATYDPSTQGAITSISYREDAIWLSSPLGVGFRTGVALRQNSKNYIVQVGEIVFGTETTWHPETATWLQNDFIELDENDPVNGFNDTSFPDFTTSGTPIEFGFFRTRTTSPGGGGAGPYVSGIDNWQMTIHRVPEPGTLALAALALAVGLLGRRRSYHKGVC